MYASKVTIYSPLEFDPITGISPWGALEGIGRNMKPAGNALYEKCTRKPTCKIIE
jgi:hypothetical protein